MGMRVAGADKTSKAPRQGEGVQAVERALDVLAAFTSAQPTMTAGMLLKRLNLSRPTLYRMLGTLEKQGFVVSEGDPQRFRLGPRVGELSRAWSAGLDVVRIASPFLERLWAETDETVALYIRAGRYRTCLAELPSDQPLTFRRGVGYQTELHAGASGRSILAYLDDANNSLDKFLREEGVNRSDYLADLKTVRAKGYAVSQEEVLKGAIAIAAPFFGPDGVMGSIAVFGPSARLTSKAISENAQLLMREAVGLSQALGAVRE